RYPGGEAQRRAGTPVQGRVFWCRAGREPRPRVRAGGGGRGRDRAVEAAAFNPLRDLDPAAAGRSQLGLAARRSTLSATAGGNAVERRRQMLRLPPHGGMDARAAARVIEEDELLD